MDRRRLLRSLGAAATAGVAGCQTVDDGAQPVDDGDAPADGATTSEWSVDPLEQDKLVGAFYYAWYWGDDGYAIHRDRPWLAHSPYTPTFGQYDSRDPDVVNQQIAWALENGVNWFVINTGHPGGPIMDAVGNTFREAALADRIHYAFDIGFDHGPVTDEDGRYVVDDPRNVAEYRRYFRAYTDFFDDPNYVRFDGRPVLFDFSTARLTGDIAGALEAVATAIDEDPYMVANPTGFWAPPAVQPDVGLTPEEIFAAYDAVRKYAAIPPTGHDEAEANYPAYLAAQTEYWRFLSDHHDTAFIPTVMPGFDDREIQWDRVHHEALDLTDEEFRAVCRRALDYVDPALDAVVITSWNEFPEGSAIEPTEEYGHRRLDVVREELGEPPAEPVPVEDYRLLEFAFDRTVRPDGAPEAMQLAFFLEELVLVGESGPIRSYDVGTVGEEPPFVAGAYNRGTHGQHTGRWLGGPDELASCYVHPDAADSTEVALTGRPIAAGEVTAEVSLDDESAGRVRFETPGDATYRVSV